MLVTVTVCVWQNSSLCKRRQCIQKRMKAHPRWMNSTCEREQSCVRNRTRVNGRQNDGRCDWEQLFVWESLIEEEINSPKLSVPDWLIFIHEEEGPPSQLWLRDEEMEDREWISDTAGLVSNILNSITVVTTMSAVSRCRRQPSTGATYNAAVGQEMRRLFRCIRERQWHFIRNLL